MRSKPTFNELNAKRHKYPKDYGDDSLEYVCNYVFNKADRLYTREDGTCGNYLTEFLDKHGEDQATMRIQFYKGKGISKEIGIVIINSDNFYLYINPEEKHMKEISEICTKLYGVSNE